MGELMQMMWFTDDQVNEFLMGRSSNLHQLLGAHLLRNEQNEIVKTRFLVYAPNAKEVRLVSSFNNYEGWKHVLAKVHHQGFFCIEIPENLEWATYKYEIHTQSGRILHKADPFGFFAEERPNTASKVYDIESYAWHDQDWQYHKKKTYEEPLLIYEVHLGSWRRKYGAFKKFNEVVDELIAYVKDQGFTHVELLPVYEYPLDDSWGYQGTGYFSTTSRYGVPKDFMYFTDRMHQAGIGVIMDWVLGHICKDAHGLSYFDGTPLFEFNDKRRRENVTWGTNNLDFSKGITRSFMLSALTFWMDYFHIDGYRIDAVSNLIYYLGDRSQGINHDAINFIRQLSYHLFAKDDRVLFMAEDSTDYPQVTHPISVGGMGFNYKWNMGFMNDVLRYFKEDPIHRKFHHDKITFGLIYAFNEQFILPFSHDEVVHMKGSLINKMPGDYFQQFANWRLLMTLWMTHPGKKLLFMGQEFASFSEWAFQKELDWNLFDFPPHQQANRFFKDLAAVYRHHDALYKYDYLPKTFEWLVADDENQSVFAFLRKSDVQMLVVVLNMTPNVHETYDIGVPESGFFEEIINSDKEIYFGSGQYNGVPLKTIKGERQQFQQFIQVKLGPLAGTILKYRGKK
ncbi:MAG: 1,4-alpha-glucan branching protein GlgB [Acholeplasmataceae bacterium]|nr:1,4-alpha-glucan branching protein GlgB [Acholeplasmataceae bacterium]